MKRLTILALSLLCTTCAFAQSDTNRYQSIFGDTLTVWYDFAQDHIGSSNTLVMGVHKGDSCMVGSQKNYRLKPMPNTLYSIHYFWHNSIITDNTLFVRESETNDKVYLLFKTGDTSFVEITLMDLNLNVGDTLPSLAPLASIAPDGYAINKTVIVDSILYDNGLKTIYTNLYHQSRFGTDTLKFIEGVGPSFGLMYPLLFNDDVNECFYMRCQEKDSVLNYHYGIEPIDCWWGEHAENVRNADDSKPLISPNPTKNILSINNLPETKWSISLYSVQGTPLIDLSGSGKNEQLDLSFLPSGTYYLVIRSEGNITRKKIIKI